MWLQTPQRCCTGRDSFDVLAFSYAHFPSAQRAHIYQRLAAALKPGGHVIVEVFGKRQIEYQALHASGGPKDVDFLFTLDDLRELFQGYEIIELLEG